MGMFLQAAVIPGRGQAETVRALEAAAAAQPRLEPDAAACGVFPNQRGTLVILNPECTGCEPLAQVLSRQLCAVLLAYLYDGDF